MLINYVWKEKSTRNNSSAQPEDIHSQVSNLLTGKGRISGPQKVVFMSKRNHGLSQIGGKAANFTSFIRFWWRNITFEENIDKNRKKCCFFHWIWVDLSKKVLTRAISTGEKQEQIMICNKLVSRWTSKKNIIKSIIVFRCFLKILNHKNNKSLLILNLALKYNCFFLYSFIRTFLC